MREFHLFAGIGGGIYGGKLLGHSCVGAVEIDDFCKSILRQRQEDGWLDTFDIFGDLCQLKGKPFRGSFDILCGGFPCQAFSSAAHGKNIAEKNLWGEMKRFIVQSEAPIVFGENVAHKAILQAERDLSKLGYVSAYCMLSNGKIGADHQRNRFWILACHKDALNNIKQLYETHQNDSPLTGDVWSARLPSKSEAASGESRRQRLKAVGNAQSPLVAASAFRVLLNRFEKYHKRQASEETLKQFEVSSNELSVVFTQVPTAIKKTFSGNIEGYLHTPTTMANYSCKSMEKHRGCRNFIEVFGKPNPDNAEWLMGFPEGASSPNKMDLKKFKKWQDDCR